MSNETRRGLSNFTVIVLLVIAFGVGAAVGVSGWIWMSGGSGEASLSIEDALATRDAEDDSVVNAVGTVVVDAVNVVIAQVADMGATLEAEFSEPVEFAIVSEESQATFTLLEDLRGVRTTVIGATNEVGGSIMVDMRDPTASSIGAIIINARTLETDNNFRNRAIRSQILRSAQDEYEFIVFEPRQLSNFSADTASIGDTISFDVSGDLTVADVTRSETFTVEVTLDSEDQISGRAMVQVLRGDYGLTIPDVPGVANVTDEVDLALEFVARAAS